jgi:hypothetical protein
MTWISLVCLLALSSSAFGRSTYGSFPSQEPVRDWSVQPRPTMAPVSSGYGQMNTFTTPFPIQQDFPTTPKMTVNYGSYAAHEQFLRPKSIPSFDESILVPKQLSPADLICRGKRAETIIPLEDGRRYVVCIDESKGIEQVCPKSLFYNLESKRCERRMGQIENPCGLQGCLNGGQCLPLDVSTFRCKCAPGFDGSNCELDARVCQTQQPCGQAAGTRCQSFRAGAALEYICIHQNELAYGFSGQQVTSSPCRNIDGALPLGITDKGFVMCDGERMFVESCPGGTIWDDSAKACVWPDMVGLNTITPTFDQTPTTSYGSSYGTPEPVLPSRPIVQEQPKMISSYGQVELPRSTFELPKPKPVSTFGEIESRRPTFDFPTQGQVMSSYGSQSLPKPTFTQPIQKEFRPMQHSTTY